MRRDHAERRVREDLSASGLRIAVLVARFNVEITDELLGGTRDCFRAHGADDGDVEVFRVPGAWELPQAASRIVDASRYDAVVALGCVIRGETPHFEYICAETSRGLGAVARDSSIPVTFGVLTTDTVEQARIRAGRDEMNKGWEAALAALEMVRLYQRVTDTG